MNKLFCVIICLVFCGGCGAVRFAPDESQKLNAYLLNKTAGAAAQIAKEKNYDSQLCALTELAAKQSEAVVAYYGKPDDAPQEIDAGLLTDDSVSQIADIAYDSAVESYSRSADNILELTIGLCGLFGGAFGIKAASFLTAVKNKSKALEEIITGNEKFKAAYPQYSELFKKSQKHQSSATKKIVTEIKTA